MQSWSSSWTKLVKGFICASVATVYNKIRLLKKKISLL